jgi:ribonuclease BN (tRNA processing enzyme)
MTGGVRVQFLGTGGPFGAGGRFQSCILIEHGGERYLLDCGMTSLAAMAGVGIEPRTIDAVLVTHLHGDHVGGVPLLICDSVNADRPEPPRTRPLRIAGPAGTEATVREALELYRWPRAMPALAEAGLLEFTALAPGQETAIGPFRVIAYAARHTPEALAFRVACGGRAIGYSGDSAWTETLLDVAGDADLFILNVYSYAIPIDIILDYRQLVERRDQLRCKRLILTHIGAEMQARLADVTETVAEDGMVVEL